MMSTDQILESGVVEHLGPAPVVAADGGAAEVALPDGRVVAVTLALQLPYKPALGDVLLVIKNPTDCWAIGVLHGQGRLDLALQGDVAVHAVGGKLELSGDSGVAIRGDHVEVQAGTFNLLAQSLVQTCVKAATRVKELFSVSAGRSHVAVNEDATTTARNTVTLAKENVTLNGKQINIG